jgi:hypothetical protein
MNLKPAVPATAETQRETVIRLTFPTTVIPAKRSASRNPARFGKQRLTHPADTRRQAGFPLSRESGDWASCKRPGAEESSVGEEMRPELAIRWQKVNETCGWSSMV